MLRHRKGDRGPTQEGSMVRRTGQVCSGAEGRGRNQGPQAAQEQEEAQRRRPWSLQG